MVVLSHTRVKLGKQNEKSKYFSNETSRLRVTAEHHQD
jgi:hypothetical protein